jgi:transcription initiation factor TFIIIB Brf1 subunit/transcription initiation factor TFIIB
MEIENISEAIQYMDDCTENWTDVGKSAWKTLKAAILVQQTNNRQNILLCPKCGSDNTKGRLLCNNCGTEYNNFFKGSR